MERTLTEYQRFTRTTAIYPDARSGSVPAVMYCALEVADEAGEVAGKVKKLYRDAQLDEQALAAEIGDVLWPLARLCDELGLSLQSCMELNIQKLSGRKLRGVLSGSGDNR